LDTAQVVVTIVGVVLVAGIVAFFFEPGRGR
jgi:hypothetical protein